MKNKKRKVKPKKKLTVKKRLDRLEKFVNRLALFVELR